MAQFDPNLLLEINHLPLVLSFLVHEGLLLLLQPLLDALLVLDDPIQGVALLPHVLLALLPGVEESLHPASGAGAARGVGGAAEAELAVGGQLEEGGRARAAEHAEPGRRRRQRRRGHKKGRGDLKSGKYLAKYKS